MSGGGGYPPDNSMQIMMMQIAAEERARERERLEAEERDRELAQLRSNALAGGRTSALNYFESQGLDPDEYAAEVEDYLSNIGMGINPDDPNPGSYYQNVGPRVYEQEETGARGRYGRTIDQFAPYGFETRRLADTADDPTLAAVGAEQRGLADEYINNLLSRGVITESGKTAAMADLDRQRYTVDALLNEIGQGVLESGRSRLRGKANEGRAAASQYQLGQQFDPYQYSTDIDTAFNDIIANLGSSIRGRVTGPLFKTSGLAAIAGAGQKAQNTTFDPNALAGLFAANDDEDEDEELRTGTTAF